MIKVIGLLFALAIVCHGCGCGCGCCTQICPTGGSNGGCEGPSGGSCLLGLKNGYIPDRAITSSSYWDSDNRESYHPKHGRLDASSTSNHFGVWASGKNVVGEWIQVSLEKATIITGVVTQGRPGSDQWVTEYKISYKGPYDEIWVPVINSSGLVAVFPGNTDAATHVTNKFSFPIVAIKLRLFPTKLHRHMSLRHDYLTC